MLERQVLRRPVDPCYTADDRSYDNRQGNRAAAASATAAAAAVVVVIVVAVAGRRRRCRRRRRRRRAVVVVICWTKSNITSVIFKIKTNLCFKSKIINGITKLCKGGLDFIW